MSEILGEYFSCKVEGIDDYESDVIFIPADDLFVFGVLG